MSWNEIGARARRLLRRAARNSARVVARLSPSVFRLAVLALFALLAKLALGGFGERLGDMDKRVEDHRVLRGGPLTQEIFRKLRLADIIHFDNAGLKLEARVNCEAETAGFAAPEPSDERKSLIRQFCHSDPGRTIRTEIEQWKSKRSTLAVRDDRDAGAPCLNHEPTDFYIPTGCRQAAWEARFNAEGGMGASDAATAPVLPDFPSPDVYGFVAALHPKAGFGDWTRFDATDSRGGKMILRTKVAPRSQSGEITVDVIGHVGNTAAHKFVSGVEGDDTLDRRTLCVRRPGDVGCVALEALQRETRAKIGKPFVHRLVFEHRTKQEFELEIEARPIEAFEERIANLTKASFRPSKVDEDDEQDSKIRLTDHIVARCNLVDPEGVIDSEDGEPVYRASQSASEAPDTTVCRLDWEAAREGDRTQPHAPGELRALTSDASLESDQGGAYDLISYVDIAADRPDPAAAAQIGADPRERKKLRAVASETAKTLGLVSLIGVDDTDRYSLLGQLSPYAPLGAPTRIDLAIDSRLQREAMATLVDLMNKKPQFAEISRTMKPVHDPLRRATIALVDAGPGEGSHDARTGDILAVANWPLPRPGFSEWDLRAVEAWRPALSPLAARGWTQNDAQNAPGSTFKPVIALAAIDRAARGDDDMADIIGAGLDSAGVARVFGAEYGFGWNARELKVPIFAGRNRENKEASIKTASGALCSDIFLGGCGNPSNRATMHDMLTQSNNLWFARLALALDQDNVSVVARDGRRIEFDQNNQPREPRLEIARMVCRLWPRSARNLFEGVEAILPGARVSLGSRLWATPIQLDETNPGQPRLLSVAQNGIGQQAQATPVAMASIMASIATGKIVLPRLLLSAPRAPDEGGAADADKDPCAKWRAGGSPPKAGDELFDSGAVDGKPLEADRASTMLDDLRSAMADVVKRGTARDAFASAPDLAARLHGKTGTAQIVKHEANDPASKNDYDTVWFVGWIDRLDGLPGVENRRVAFACMISHVDPGPAAGGKTCAPLMRALFRRIEKRAEPPPAAAKPAHPAVKNTKKRRAR